MFDRAGHRTHLGVVDHTAARRSPHCSDSSDNSTRDDGPESHNCSDHTNSIDSDNLDSDSLDDAGVDTDSLDNPDSGRVRAAYPRVRRRRPVRGPAAAPAR